MSINLYLYFYFYFYIFLRITTLFKTDEEEDEACMKDWNNS